MAMAVTLGLSIAAADPPTEIPWEKFQMYNTLMGLAAGVALLLVVLLGWKLYRRAKVDLDGYAIAFGVTGALLTFLGGHMTVNWPLSVVPQANIIFGEGCLAFGVLLLAAALYLWRFRTRHGVEGDDLTERLLATMKPVSLFIAALGLGMAAIGIAGIKYKLFGAPPEEPISGEFADHPMVESVFVSVLYFLIAVGAVLAPLFVAKLNRVVGTIIAVSWTAAGLAWILFAALNYYTHIGLIVNTT